jgi:hypothetical protein
MPELLASKLGLKPRRRSGGAEAETAWVGMFVVYLQPRAPPSARADPDTVFKEPPGSIT